MARKILLADDSVTAQNMGRKILADAGYEVIAVNNGSAALKKILEIKPDLVILDVYMPGYSGLEVCQRLKESPETARIPVLLTVGKLEPFKPDEAQRVRAEGFIVKPFEASELLSALSKLEDKVVPRAEPSKPGRFARAIAAVEESSRNNRKESATSDDGWKSRIAFPHEKTEPEEKDAEEAATYNPVNRDLRTVVETAAEKEGSRAQGNVPEPSVDVAALAPAGLPKDVTPEEVAAIAAAAAQMQMASAAAVDQPRAAEVQLGGNSIEPEPATQSRADVASPKAEAEVSCAPVVASETAQEQTVAQAQGLEASKDDSKINIQHEIEPGSSHRRISPEKSEQTQDVPVTMAATTESAAALSTGPARWTAVPVALEDEEAALLLEREMQNAYATLVDRETGSAVVASLPEQVKALEATPAARSEEVPAGLPTEVAPEAAKFAPVASSVAQPETESAAAIAQQTQPVSQAEAREAASAVSSQVVAANASGAEGSGGHPGDVKADPEMVKSTAEAWANWRQSRDTTKDGEVAQAQPREFEVPPEPAPAETAALAVAAGAEQIMKEASTPPSDGPDVANIVDSVLAGLRPKLMEEISRKMAEKK